MLDLAKPYGTHEDILFYGDHEQDNIVYYLPNEVGLAPVILEDGTKNGAFDFFLQIFKEGRAIKGGLEELENSSGAIMSLGVQCIARKERLEKARNKMIDRYSLPEDFIFTPPEWHDGSIDLIILDTTTRDETTINEESFVESIIGSKKPSLSSSDLKAVFNVRLDRKGASLIAATLKGDRSSVAGVLYDLKLRAMRPALDMTIEADLDRCHTKVSHMIAAGAAIKYGELTVSAKAEFEFIKEKLIEDGDIKVNIISQVTDADMKKMVDDMVKEFSDRVMRELFRPYISPEIPNLPDGVPNPTPGDGILIGVAYKFQKKKLFHNKRLFVDYRQRSATLKTHNPQSHLWLLGNQIKDDIDNYTKTVTFGNLWREHHLEIDLLHDFEDDQHDLLSAEVLIWRKKDGVRGPDEQSHGFLIPEDAVALIHYTITKDDREKQKIAWITEPEEPSGYYYQVKFTYDHNLENVNSPSSLFSKAIFSSSQDLIIIPQVLAPLKVITFKYVNIDHDKVRGVDIYLRSKDKSDRLIFQDILSLSAENKEEVWKVRNRPFNEAILEEERHFHFKDGRPTLKQNPTLLLDEELIVADPFEFKNAKIIPVITGNTNELIEILLELDYKATTTDFEYSKLFRAKTPDFLFDEIIIPVLEKSDLVDFKFTAITKEGDLIQLHEGQIERGPLLLKIEEIISKNSLEIIWQGPDLNSEDLDYVRMEFQLRKEDGNEVMLNTKQFNRDESLEPIHFEFPSGGTLFIKITKRYIDGSKERGRFKKVDSDKIIIKP